jgi:hypothetical protein
MLKFSRLFALLALLAVGLLAGCGSDEKSGGGSSGDKSEDPTALLKKALSANVESGELKVKAAFEVKGSPKVSGPVTATLEGPFKSRGKEQLPLLDWDVSLSGAGQNFSGGIVATEDNAFVKFRGQTYEVGKQLYEQFVRQQSQQAKSGPQSFKDLGIDPSGWLEDPQVADGESIGGSATRKVTGQIDVEKMVDDVLKAADSPAVRKQLQSSGQSLPKVSDADKQKLVDAVEKADLTVNVDDEDIARKVVLSAAFKVPEGVDADGASGGSFELSYELPKVGGDVDITAPSDAKPLSLLMQQLGLGAGMPGGGLKTQ